MKKSPNKIDGLAWIGNSVNENKNVVDLSILDSVDKIRRCMI